MKRHLWTKLGIIEVVALTIVWLSTIDAPLVAYEYDADDRTAPRRRTRAPRGFRSRRTSRRLTPSY